MHGAGRAGVNLSRPSESLARRARARQDAVHGSAEVDRDPLRPGQAHAQRQSARRARRASSRARARTSAPRGPGVVTDRQYCRWNGNERQRRDVPAGHRRDATDGRVFAPRRSTPLRAPADSKTVLQDASRSTNWTRLIAGDLVDPRPGGGPVIARFSCRATPPAMSNRGGAHAAAEGTTSESGTRTVKSRGIPLGSPSNLNAAFPVIFQPGRPAASVGLNRSPSGKSAW